MDRAWMSSNRLTHEYEQGIHSFCNFTRSFAKRNGSEYVHCPCMGCLNNKKVKVGKLINHLLLSSINLNYKVWRMHGETEPRNDAPQVFSPLMDDINTEWEDDDLIDTVTNIAKESNVRPKVLETLRNDSELSLYKGCAKFTMQSVLLKLFNLEAKSGWSGKSFNDLLQLVKEMFPGGNTLPSRTYKAKKVMCSMGITYKKIHACPNDCILYRNDHSDFVECPVCKSSRYKPNKGLTTDSKGSPAKVLWYLPIIPRIQRLYSNPEDAEHMRWHVEKRIVGILAARRLKPQIYLKIYKHIS
ncbi:unnamed protein product [Rhodiola kirilowii]